MSSCIKTGAILKVIGYDVNVESETLYGDLHLIGNCCLMYYPDRQVPLEKTHGTLYLNTEFEIFSRKGQPYNILVLPAKCVELNSNDIHPIDMEKFNLARYFDGRRLPRADVR